MDNIPVALYLLFQIFVSSVSTTAFPPQGEIDATVSDIVSRIGTTGNNRHKLGFAVGPIAFNQNDDEVRRLITESFQIARKKNIAVCFHLDDHMFWEKRADLFSDKSNVEWIDWKETPSTGRRLDWGPEPTKVAPQLCFNSPAVKNAVAKRARFIATEIKREFDRLKAERKQELFAGIIIGWETLIGRDFSTNKSTGYHALTNAGLSAKNSKAQCDAALSKIVKEYIEMWAQNLAQCGLPTDKIYSHVAFTAQGLGSAQGVSYAEQVGFAIPDVAFSSRYRAGFSTYPFEDTIEQIHQEVTKHGSPPWISAEGTNVVPNGMLGEPTMESYLAKMFNHGAVMVNIFSWGMGGEAQKNNLFRRATENEEALASYRKFLKGESLKERTRPANMFSVKRFQQKIQTIQSEAPAWVRKTGNMEQMHRLMTQLDSSIKGQRIEDADKTADEILQLIHRQ